MTTIFLLSSKTTAAITLFLLLGTKFLTSVPLECSFFTNKYHAKKF